MTGNAVGAKHLAPGERRRRVGMLVATVIAGLVTGCGGDGGASNTPSAPPASYTVGGTVSGLLGSGLTLMNGPDRLSVAANGSFVLPTKLATGASYALTVITQPGNPIQSCTVQDGSGTVYTAAVTTIAVTCTSAVVTYGYAAVPHSASDASVGLVEHFAYNALSGQLTLRSSTATGTDTYAFYVRATPSGRQLLVSTSTLVDRANATLRNDLSLYDLIAKNGTPTRPVLLASPGGSSPVFHPNGTDLYTIDATLRHFSLVAGATQGQALAIGSQPGLASAMTPNGKFLFVPLAGQDGGSSPSIAVVSLADPQQPQLAMKVSTRIRPLTATISVDGTLLYVTPIDAGDPGYVYRVDAAGNLTQAGTFSAPTYARSSAIPVSGQFLYLASSEASKVQAYKLDAGGGVTALDSGVAVPFAYRLVPSPDGKYLYVISTPPSGGGAIYGFAIGVDGRLSPIAGSPFTTGEREADLTFTAVSQ